MDKLINFFSKLALWQFISLFTFVAILISESLILLQSYWLTGDFFDKNLLIVGFITPTIDAFIIFLFVGILIQSLALVKKRLQDAQKVAHIGFWELNYINDTLYWSDEVYSIIGETPKSFEVTFDKFLEYVHPDDRENLKREYQSSMREKREYKITHRIIQKNGSIRYVEEKCKHLYESDGNISKSIGSIYDITEKIIYAQKVQQVFDLQKNILIELDGETLTNANRAFLDFFGYKTLEEFLLENENVAQKFLKHDNYFHLSKVEKNMLWTEMLVNLPEEEHIVSMQDKNSFSHAFSININRIDGNIYIASFTDITKTITEKDLLNKRIIHDNLTGAYNRDYFNNTIDSFLKRKQKHDIQLGLIIFDIDFFKKINDTYGHNTGDAVLIQLVNAVKKRVRQQDVLIRWGGEEFIILMSIDSLEILKEKTEQIRSHIYEEYFESVGQVTCSFGITLHQSGEDIYQTINRADKALYKAKSNGKNRVEFM